MDSSPPCAAWKIFLIFTCGLAILLFGVLSPPMFNKIIRGRIQDEVPLREPVNGSEPALSFRFWRDIPQPMRMKFYLFEVANPLEVVENGEAPYLLERGPYVYEQKRYKKDIVFAENGTIVSYREERTFRFLPEESVGGENDSVRLLNVPFLSVLQQSRGKNWFERKILEGLIASTKTELFQTKTVWNWIWGCDDPLLIALKGISQPVPFTFFGWFMHRNNSAQANVTIYTGVGNLTNEGQIVSYNGKSELDVWRDKYCNAINGTDGTMFHPFVTKSDWLYMFSPDICRSLYGVFESETTIQGLQAYKFIIPIQVFDNETTNPDNACYCVPDDSHCLGTGLLNISQCQFGAPVVSSQPHLFQANPAYLARIRGLSPDASRHQTILHVEPHIGMVLDAAKRLQINGYVEKIPVWSKYFQNFPDRLIFPVIWIEESALLDDHTASVLRETVADKLRLVDAIVVAVDVVGAFLIGVALLLTAHLFAARCRRGEKAAPLGGKLVRVDSEEEREVSAAPAAPTELGYENPLVSGEEPRGGSYGAIGRTPPRDKRESSGVGPEGSVNPQGKERTMPDWLENLS